MQPAVTWIGTPRCWRFVGLTLLTDDFDTRFTLGLLEPSVAADGVALQRSSRRSGDGITQTLDHLMRFVDALNRRPAAADLRCPSH